MAFSSPPPADTVHSSSCRESKMMSTELGDQRGVPGTKPFKEPTGDACAPVASQVQISSGPARSEMNTTRFPSGEYIGLLSRRDEDVNGSGVRLPSASG